MESREKDNASNGFAQRRFFDLKTTVLILTAMLGTGGITGITSYYTDPNIAVQAKVERMDTEIKAHQLDFSMLKSEVKFKSLRVENYIKSHAEEENLRLKLSDQEFKHIRELLVEIKADIKIIKNGN